MLRKEKYAVVSQLKEEINRELAKKDFEIHKFVLKYGQNTLLDKVGECDNQLFQLRQGIHIWCREVSQCEKYGMRATVFDKVKSLKDLEHKFLRLEKGILRFATPMPEVYYEEVIDYIIEEKISGIFCFWACCIREPESNIVNISKRLRKRGKYATAIVMLEEALINKPDSESVRLELAACWMDGAQWERAYESLVQIENPGIELRCLMGQLEKMISHEKI